jgi:hypothetical protein
MEKKGDVMPQIEEYLESEKRRYEKFNKYFEDRMAELDRLSKLPDDNEEKIAMKIEIGEELERLNKNCGGRLFN